MRGKVFVWLLATLLLMTASMVKAQQPGKIPRIGYLVASSASTSPGRTEAFLRGLRELGYVEGKNLVVEWRYAEGKLDRLADLAAELVGLKLDVIVSAGPSTTRPLKDATTTIPIVMGFDNDPVSNGFVASLARPGGNITGLSTLAPEISGKQLELLRETVPKLTRAAVFGTSRQPGNAQSLKETELAAKALAVKLQYLDILDAKDLEPAFRTASKGRAEAILALNSPVFNSQRKLLVELAAKHRLPAIYNAAEFVEAGGLMTYGVSFTDLLRRAATYVDKILKGRTPADLPVEQPIKFDFVVNLQAAKQIGLRVPPNLLVRADRVIK